MLSSTGAAWRANAGGGAARRPPTRCGWPAPLHRWRCQFLPRRPPQRTTAAHGGLGLLQNHPTHGPKTAQFTALRCLPPPAFCPLPPARPSKPAMPNCPTPLPRPRVRLLFRPRLTPREARWNSRGATVATAARRALGHSVAASAVQCPDTRRWAVGTVCSGQFGHWQLLGCSITGCVANADLVSVAARCQCKLLV